MFGLKMSNCVIFGSQEGQISGIVTFYGIETLFLMEIVTQRSLENLKNSFDSQIVSLKCTPDLRQIFSRDLNRKIENYISAINNNHKLALSGIAVETICENIHLIINNDIRQINEPLQKLHVENECKNLLNLNAQLSSEYFRNRSWGQIIHVASDLSSVHYKMQLAELCNYSNDEKQSNPELLDGLPDFTVEVQIASAEHDKTSTTGSEN